MTKTSEEICLETTVAFLVLLKLFSSTNNNVSKVTLLHNKKEKFEQLVYIEMVS